MNAIQKKTRTLNKWNKLNFIFITLIFSLFDLNSYAQNKPINITFNEPNIIELFENDDKPHQVPILGNQADAQVNMTGVFTFDKKIGFEFQTSEGIINSYFYFNSQYGYSWLESDFFELVAGEPFEGGQADLIQLIWGQMHYYVKSSEGSYYMNAPFNWDANFPKLKKTGKTISLGDKKEFKAVEYYFKNVDGEDGYIYFSKSNRFKLNTKKTNLLLGLWGLGYVNSNKNNFLLVGFKGKGIFVKMTYVKNVSKSFDARAYKTMGSLMAGVEDMGKFAQSNNLEDLSNSSVISSSPNESASNNMLDMAIQGLEQSLSEIDNQIREAQAQNNTRVVNRLKCDRACNIKQINEWTAIKTEYQILTKSYKDNDEKRDEEFNKLMEIRILNITPCECN